MSCAEVLVESTVPKSDHVHAPHRHHRQPVCLTYGIEMTQIQQTVPAHGQRVVAYMVRLTTSGDLARRRAEPLTG